jgi:hypothetical protein
MTVQSTEAPSAWRTRRRTPEKEASMSRKPYSHAQKEFWLHTLKYVIAILYQVANGGELEFDEELDVGWRVYIEKRLHIDPTFIRSVYALCTERMSRKDSFLFLLRGLGCPDTDGLRTE